MKNNRGLLIFLTLTDKIRRQIQIEDARYAGKCRERITVSIKLCEIARVARETKREF